VLASLGKLIGALARRSGPRRLGLLMCNNYSAEEFDRAAWSGGDALLHAELAKNPALRVAAKRVILPRAEPGLYRRGRRPGEREAARL